jgi:hypothetical protein
MAMKRFPITNVVGDLVDQHRDPDEKLYASLELNQVAFPKTGMVVSQTPLGAAFTKAAPCENGMWVVADKAAGVINAPAAATDSPIGIVYTTEKEYDREHYGLQRFGRKIAGDYPRVGIFGLGDTVTTNCLQYDDTEFATEKALWDALEAIDTTPLYVGVVAGSAVPKLTKTKPASGVYAKVVKYYTVPNGGKGVKYQIVSLG